MDAFTNSYKQGKTQPQSTRGKSTYFLEFWEDKQSLTPTCISRNGLIHLEVEKQGRYNLKRKYVYFL